MLLDPPDYPQVVLSFTYRQVQLDLAQADHNGYPTYTVWANHAYGFAVAVPAEASRRAAIYRAKQWVDRRWQSAP